MVEEGKKVIYQLVNGFKIPLSFSAERFLSTINYKARDDDIFLVTYPRCGTTWMHQILYLIFHNGNPPKDGKDFMTSCPYLELLGAEAAENAKRPCALKVHLPYHLTPHNAKAKYIYLTRNPKDCCVSFYHFVGKKVGDTNFTFDEYFEYFITGEVGYGDYFDNVLSWYEHKNDPNILFFTYEEMKTDLPQVIQKLCEFLGERYVEVIKNNGIMNNILKYSSFGFMKTTVNEGLGEVADKPDDEKVLEGVKEVWAKKGKTPEKELVRKGELGDWKNHFSDDQNRRMDEKIQSKLKSTGLIEIWMKAGVL